MSRKAVIIESSNVNGQANLPGALVDQQNWINFLKSDLGGAWYDSEIELLSKPSSMKVEKLLDDHKDKYCFLAFSGHGSNNSIVLNENRLNYPISGLRPKSEKGTLIIDSCRGIDSARVISFSAAKTRYLAEASEGHAVIANSARGYSTKFGSADKRRDHHIRWNFALILANKGVVEMYACSKGEGANEDPNAGGYYTSLLLQSADLWQQLGGDGNIYTTKDAHNHAVSKLPPQQNPEYRPSHLAFPFAVSV